MKLTLKLKPTRVVRNTVSEIRAVITGRHCWTGAGGREWSISGYMPYTRGAKDPEFVRVYSLEKRRKKVEVLEKPVKWNKKKLRANGYLPTDEKWDKRVVVEPAHWVGHYYDIPVVMIRMLGLEVKQGTRTFTIKQIKKG